MKHRAMIRGLLVMAAGAVLFASLIGLEACSTTARQRAFDLFFDPEEVESAPLNRQDAGVAEQGAPVAAVPILPVATKRFQHQPFERKECEKCHISKMSNRMKDPMPGLCFNCHTNFLAGREEADVHKPVFKGKCMKCHEAHQSSFTNLLKDVGTELCYKCHDDVAADRKVVHKPVTEGKCSACHLAHVSSHKALLAKSTGELCNDCHKPYEGKSVHKPVVQGKCQSCHATHASQFAGLVKRTGNAQCDDCHEPDEMAKVPKHKGTESMRCAECHEVHRSDLDHLMKPGARSPP